MSDEIEVQIPDKLFFRIGELSELVGVEPHVLRYWEQEFRVRPQRSPSGQRMYRRKDISRFLQIKNLLYKQGFTIAGARRALTASKEDGGGGIVSDPDQLREARQRIAKLRGRIAELRAQTTKAWDDALS